MKLAVGGLWFLLAAGCSASGDEPGGAEDVPDVSAGPSDAADAFSADTGSQIVDCVACTPGPCERAVLQSCDECVLESVGGCCQIDGDCGADDDTTSHLCVEEGCQTTRLVGSCMAAGDCAAPSQCETVDCVEGACRITDFGTGCCQADSDCDDGDQCTDDECVSGECRAAPREGPCDDDDECTGSDMCSLNGCQGQVVTCPGCAECDTDEGCVPNPG